MDSLVIAWNDGSGDSLYLSLSGDSVEITSDANWSGQQRAKTLTFATTTGSASAQLLVSQGVGADGVIITHDNILVTENGVAITEQDGN